MYYDWEFLEKKGVEESRSRAGIVVENQGNILMVRQYRLIIDGIALELPSGGVDQNETELEAAIRECFEETGVKCLETQPLLFFHSGLDSVFSPNHLFLSTRISDLVEERELNPKEILESVWVPLEDCLQMIAKGEIQDGFTIAGLMAYKLRLQNNS